MDQVINVSYVANAIFFSLMGCGIFGLGFYVVDKITPYELWKELVEKQNTALAIVVGSIAISIGLIIASAIQG